MINLSIDKRVFNDVYLPYLTDYSNRYEVYYGGAGSGKSVFVAQKLVYKACLSKRKVLVIRKYGTTLRDSVFQLFQDTLSKWQLMPFCKVNLSSYTITLPNGSMFLFKGLDDSEKIKSITDITDIFCEEATELSEDEYTQLDLRLRAMVDGLQLIVAFNPVSKVNWVYRRWFDDHKIPYENTLILHTNYKHNKFLPQSYIDALEDKAKTNYNYYKIYALGEFCTLDKLIFTNWKVEDFEHATIKGALLVGLDFGFVNDVSALVASICDEENKKIYIFREWGSTGKTNEELASIITSLGFAKSDIIADAAEQKSIEEIKRCGIRKIRACTKGKDSIIHGIDKLQSYEIIVHSNCTEIKTEFENYSWKKDKASGLYVNEPIDAFNHYIDALRYSLQCLQTNKMKSLNKSVLGL
ncbi:MAG: PBSX family phage terminase large subunit [Clostridia bacterium]|nr:PBSX family phage terminase large subunit [Clostridia bacterium]